MYIVTSFFMFHYTQLYFMYFVTSFLCFTTELYFMYSVTSNVHEAQLCVVKHNKRGDNVHEVQLCVVKYKKRGDNVHEAQLCVVKYAVLHVHCHLFFIFHYKAVFHADWHLFFMFHYTQSCTSCTLPPLFLYFTTKEVTMYMKHSCV
jgi:hypothetical protein